MPLRCRLPLLVLLNVARSAFSAPRPPSQPARGPGGGEYRHHAVTVTQRGEGEGAYWVFEPAQPTPGQAPVIVFLHGWGGMNPRGYRGWINHLVKRGNLVVYPRYQASLRTPTRSFTANALAAVREAVAWLRSSRRVLPDRQRFAVVGHSAGGNVSANFACRAAANGLPTPRAVMCVEPGITWRRVARINIPLDDLSTMPSGILLLTVAGDQDDVVQDIDARRIFTETVRIPAADKDFVTLVSDDHGDPPLVANHFAPCALADDESTTSSPPSRRRLLQSPVQISEAFTHALRPPDALDYWGLWKLFDGLCEAAFFARHREYALGNTAQQRFMGRWSDGVAVQELRVVEAPPAR